MRDGKSYVMLEGQVEEVVNGGEKLRIDFEGDNTLTLAPPRNTTFYINGERVAVNALTRGTELNFYIPEDRFQAEVAGSSVSAPFIVIPIDMQSSRTSPQNQSARSPSARTGTNGQVETTAQSGTAAQTGTTAPPASTAQTGTSRQTGTTAQTGSGSMTLMLIPTAQHLAAHAAIQSGCWTTLYAKEDFKGDALTLVGPVDLRDMVGPYGLDWDEKLASVKTGPNTTVTIYDNEAFRDRSAKLQPGSSVSDVDEKLGLFEEVQSMSVSCTPAR